MAGPSLAIDVGTSRIKAAVVEPDGSVTATVISGQMTAPRSLPSEYDPEAVWREVCSCVAQLGSAGALAGVGSIGICGHGDGCVLVDRAGRPVRSGITWRDARAASVVDAWRATGALDELGDRLPAPIFPGATLAVLAWLQRHEPDAVVDAAAVMFAKDWVRYRLTGVVATDKTDAYLIAPAPNNYRPDPKVIEVLGIGPLDRLCPPVRDSHDNVGEVGSEAAELLGLAPGIPVVAGAMDTSAAALGVDLRDDEGYSVLGTTAIHAYLSGWRTRASESSFLLPWFGPGRFLYGMAPSSAAGNLTWLANLLWPGQDRALESAEECARQVAPGSEGLLYHPYLNEGGERAPFVSPRARAQFTGLTPAHMAGHLVRSVLEGVAFAARDTYSSLGKLPKKVVLTGGGANSGLWCQIVADVLGAEVCAFSADDAGCRGLAALVGWPVKTMQRSATVRHGSRQFFPSDASARYEAAFNRYCRIRESAVAGWRGEEREPSAMGPVQVEAPAL